MHEHQQAVLNQLKNLPETVIMKVPTRLGKPSTTYTFKEALVKLSESPVIDVVARLKRLSREQDEAWEELKKLVPLEQGYVWGEAHDGTIRPFAIESDEPNGDDTPED